MFKMGGLQTQRDYAGMAS